MATTGKCFLVTGPPGVGKTTLIKRVVEKLRGSSSNPNCILQGFYTSEVREGGERVGFQVVTLDGRQGRLASTKISSVESTRWPNVGRYKVDVASFESLALPELQITEDVDLFIIDEVGKMELCSPLFFPAVLKVLESNVPILASIPVPKQGQHIPEVARMRNHPGTQIFTLDTKNRNAVAEQIYSILANLLHKR